jgi:TonB family protein
LVELVPGRRSEQRRGTVLRAGLWSTGLHTLVLVGSAALLSSAPRPRDPSTAAAAWSIPGSAHQDSDPWIDLHAPDSVVLPAESLPPLSPEEIADLPEADEANQDVNPAAGARGIPHESAAPAPDQGAGTGRDLPVAWRRDASTLRARLTTGARVYQPSREKTATRASSPQALRRERRAGVGDSARTAHPRLTEAAPVVPTLPVEIAEKDEPQPRLTEERRTPLAPGEDATRGEGPLDADVGNRGFDAPTEGPARDTVAVRQASDEPNPGLTDYASVAARGDGTQGRGRGPAPGVTSAETPGTAAASDGWPRPRPPGEEEIGEGTSERLYAREHLEIRRRVARAQRFPHRLAVMLEQGEAIVQFQVERDGRLWGAVKLLKSAGFDEFDQEALAAVQRAAPFPQMARPLLVRMRIGFTNPLVR